MSDTDTDDSKGCALMRTLPNRANTIRPSFDNRRLVSFVPFALCYGVGVGHYAALSDFCSETHDEAGMPNCRSITAASSGLGRARPL